MYLRLADVPVSWIHRLLLEASPMLLTCHVALQATPVAAGIAVGAAAYAGKALIDLAVKFRNAPPKLRQFYKVCTSFCLHIQETTG